jgi:hypothetical protein
MAMAMTIRNFRILQIGWTGLAQRHPSLRMTNLLNLLSG